jgi:L-lactate dehydrogenase complex protein LldG
LATEAATDTSAVAERITEFAQKVEPLGVRVHHVEDIDAAATIVAEMRAELAAEGVVLSDELRRATPHLTGALEAEGIVWAVPATPDDARDKPLGLSYASLAVAETGSVLLAEPTLADRATGLITRVNVVLCQTRTLVPSLDEAGKALREIALRPGGAYAALVTGPSRTADIEMSLTVGVQGPAQVHVIFVDRLSGES